MINITRVESILYRSPLTTPVRTSFGIMHSRPMLAVRVTDSDGIQGVGEVWCNFPAFGGEARAHMILNELAPHILNQTFVTPELTTDYLIGKLRVLSVQTGEIGPLSQCISGIDMALHDYVSRKSGVSLQAHLSGREIDYVPVYASGINPDAPQETVAKFRDAGYAHFKLKVGFGNEKDLANVESCIAQLPASGSLALDANQGWDVAQAQQMLLALNAFDLAWIEEPLIATAPSDQWSLIADLSKNPLAGGENIIGLEAFSQAIASPPLDVLQPDVAKWGGITYCYEIARRARAANKLYYPHFLGGGLGLMASAHVLAAAGGDGKLEVDINDNPLRSRLLGDRLNTPSNGMRLTDCLGIGVEPSLADLDDYKTLHLSAK